MQTPTQILCIPLYLSILRKARVQGKMSPLRKIYSLPKDVCVWVWVFIFLLYHGRDFCALTSLQRERMGLGQLLHQASGDGLVGGVPDAAGMAQCGSQLPATTAEPPAPVLLSPKRPPGGQQDQSISSDTELFYSSLSTQDWRLIPPLSLLLPHKIQRSCGLPPASNR